MGRLIAKLFDFKTKARHRHAVQKRVVRPELVIMQRPPFGVRALGDIGDNRVKMNIGFRIAIGIMLEQSNGEIAGTNGLDLAARKNPCFGDIFLGPLQRLDHRRPVSFDDPFIAAHQSD